jgi:hypothetical protein
MLYVLICKDKSDSQPLRLATREKHLAYVGSHAIRVVLAGPLLTADGKQMIGSLFILDADGSRQVEAFHQEDPYTRAGLWCQVEIHPFRQTLPQP